MRERNNHDHWLRIGCWQAEVVVMSDRRADFTSSSTRICEEAEAPLARARLFRQRTTPTVTRIVRLPPARRAMEYRRGVSGRSEFNQRFGIQLRREKRTMSTIDAVAACNAVISLIAHQRQQRFAAGKRGIVLTMLAVLICRLKCHCSACPEGTAFARICVAGSSSATAVRDVLSPVLIVLIPDAQRHPLAGCNAG